MFLETSDPALCPDECKRLLALGFLPWAGHTSAKSMVGGIRAPHGLEEGITTWFFVHVFLSMTAQDIWRTQNFPLLNARFDFKFL